MRLKFQQLLDFDTYKPNSFDRVLADVPCSALGQRPLIFNEITVNQLRSYVPYQRSIIENVR
jgi:16S rRNA C967 or C1407 C5-methylase (RsmB/RsmF family)